MSELQRLIEAVERGEAASTLFWCDPFSSSMNGEYSCAVNAYYGDLNAAKALHEALLPGYFVEILWWTTRNDEAIVTVGNVHQGKDKAPRPRMALGDPARRAGREGGRGMIRWREDHGRIVALSGGVEVGAVFPRPKGADWRFWIGGMTDTRSGNAKTILAAKCEILGQFRDWLTRAALAEKEG